MVAQGNNDLQGSLHIGFTEVASDFIDNDAQHIDGNSGFIGVVGLEILSGVLVVLGSGNKDIVQQREQIGEDLGE